MEVTLLIYVQHIEFNSYVIQLIARALGSNIIPENLMPSLRKYELHAGKACNQFNVYTKKLDYINQLAQLNFTNHPRGFINIRSASELSSNARDW